jgi:hypothetical protein
MLGVSILMRSMAATLHKQIPFQTKLIHSLIIRPIYHKVQIRINLLKIILVKSVIFEKIKFF